MKAVSQSGVWSGRWFYSRRATWDLLADVWGTGCFALRRLTFLLPCRNTFLAFVLIFGSTGECCCSLIKAKAKKILLHWVQWRWNDGSFDSMHAVFTRSDNILALCAPYKALWVLTTGKQRFSGILVAFDCWGKPRYVPTTQQRKSHLLYERSLKNLTFCGSLSRRVEISSKKFFFSVSKKNDLVDLMIDISRRKLFIPCYENTGDVHDQTMM